MGWGDEIIVTGQARELQAKQKLPVVVLDRNNNPRQHEIWYNNPRIAKSWDRKSAVHQLHNRPGVRPYIRHKTEGQWIWKEFTPPVGEIYLTQNELAYAHAFAKPQVIIEPNTKNKASPNKDWGWDRWVQLAQLLRRDYDVVQIGNPGCKVMQGVKYIQTPGFRIGCAVLSRAVAAVLPEGGLHHAAAALGVPSVVIYGGFISPLQTGYAIHTNLFTGGEACGMRVPCKHCAAALAAITPELVVEELSKIMERRKCQTSTTSAMIMEA